MLRRSRITSNSTRFPYMGKNVWKKLFLMKTNRLFKYSFTLLFDRSSTIPLSLTQKRVWIHRGNNFRKKYLTIWTVGFKFGEFTWNRKLAIYKAKQKRKKMKKMLKAQEEAERRRQGVEFAQAKKKNR